MTFLEGNLVMSCESLKNEQEIALQKYILRKQLFEWKDLQEIYHNNVHNNNKLES